jgi:hypothetical protein
MRFLCVGFLDRAKMDSLPEGQADAVMAKCPPFMEEFFKSGKVLVEAGAGAESRSMRRVNGRVVVTEGAIKDGVETIGCIFIVEGTDMADAVRVASLHPTTRLELGEQLGFRLEIRPVPE